MSDNSTRTTILATLVVTILIIAGLIAVIASRPEPVVMTINPPVPTPTLVPSATPSPVLVYVTGAVAQPGTTVRVPYNSRVQDVLEAVGGTTDEADLTRVNLAAVIHDGDQIHVPILGDDSEQAGVIPALPTRSGGPVIYINTAVEEELMRLPGIGAVIADRIIAYREENGPFTSIEQLGKVEGIGEATLNQIAPFLSLE
ncbi:MAG: helix-hairpin-helix domain-containing protein [Anaerolineaceae bacterium]|nr:helix-hairpin-helix domain-containing protein [Anaerolineaceae bacterium]